MSTPSNLSKRLEEKEYRDAFVASEINIGLPFQIRSLRERRGWTQSELAAKALMKQPRISAMESPGSANLNLETLRRLASAFDCALIVRFAPFSELVRWSEQFAPDSFEVKSFDEESQRLAFGTALEQPSANFLADRSENLQIAANARRGDQQPGTNLAVINRLVGVSSKQEIPERAA